MKCGWALRTSPGLLVAGQSASTSIAPAAQPKTRRLIQPGGFFPRFIAIIIDACILGVVIVPVVFLILNQTPTTVTPTGETNGLLDQLQGVTGSASNDQVVQRLQIFLGITILQLFYYVGTWSILGGSPGQLVMSLRVVDASAKTIGFGRALLRYIMKGAFGILSPVSALMVAFGKDKRAIHDLLAGTFVIQFLDPKLEDFDAVLPPAQAALPPAAPTPPPAAALVPEAIYAGAALAPTPMGGPPSAAPQPPAYATAPAPEPPAHALPPEPPAYAPPPAPPPPPPTAGDAPMPAVAPMPPAAPVAPAPAPPATPDESAFERYAAPAEPAPLPAAPGLPVFPTSDPGGYQPMAPAPPPLPPAAPATPADPGSVAPPDQPAAYQPPTYQPAPPPDAPPRPEPPAES
jgi:uncharacterized RDD family membrane protein YckC